MDEWFQEISNERTVPERTPKQPEYLIARSQLTERGPLGFGSISLFDGMVGSGVLSLTDFLIVFRKPCET